MLGKGKAFAFEHHARWVWRMALAVTQLEKGEQVVLKPQPICAEDLPPDL